jgi:sodium-dependent phosphate transporter
VQVVQDYYRGHATRADLETARQNPKIINDIKHLKDNKLAAAGEIKLEKAQAINNDSSLNRLEKANTGPWYFPKNLVRTLVAAFMHGVSKDVVQEPLVKALSAVI